MQTTYAQKNETIQKASANTAESVVDSSSQSATLQRHASLANAAAQRAENPPRPNNTGLPDDLKNGVESLSGYSLDNVRVHYNSPKPATVQALAYTQGTDIHVAPGQEHALPHEAWHVTQQMAGRVTPTTNIGGMPVNDNAALEHEADVMGEKAVAQRMMDGSASTLKSVNLNGENVQRLLTTYASQNIQGIIPLPQIHNPQRQINLARHHIVPKSKIVQFIDNFLTNGGIRSMDRWKVQAVNKYYTARDSGTASQNIAAMSEIELDVQTTNAKYNDLSEAMVWNPGNLVIGPANRADDPGDNLDKNLFKIKSVENDKKDDAEKMDKMVNKDNPNKEDRDVQEGLKAAERLYKKELTPYNADDWDFNNRGEPFVKKKKS